MTLATRWLTDDQPGEGAKQVALIWLARAMRSLDCYPTMLASEARSLSYGIAKAYDDLESDRLTYWFVAERHALSIGAVRAVAPTEVIALPGLTSTDEPSYVSTFLLLGRAESAMESLRLMQKYCTSRDRWPVSEEEARRRD